MPLRNSSATLSKKLTLYYNNYAMLASVINKIKSAPKEPGCYIFYAGKKPLYIGKAANLRNRLKSYLPAGGRSSSGGKITDIKTETLHKEATKLEYLPLRSEIEALIEESRLIKKLKPKYNIIWRDDKSYHYVYFTREAFPKVFISHQDPKPHTPLAIGSKIGPFTDGEALRIVMKLLRRIYPYCTCFQPHLRDCLNAQIEKCFGVCCKKINIGISDIPKLYRQNIRTIKMILRGQTKKLLKILIDDGEKAALKKIFEHKEFLHQRITNPLRINEFINSQQIRNSLIDALSRVEAYDNSHLSGKEAVGAMTALKKTDGAWQPDKNSYRKFKIKSASTQNDPRMIAEILTRRLNHPEWPYPDLIIIDGGIAQYRAAKKTLLENSHYIYLISFAKPKKLVYGLKPNDEPTPLKELPEAFQKLIELAIYQTHNFVIRYHRRVRQRNFLL